MHTGCQYVIRKLVYNFMCMLVSSVTYIIKDIQATSLLFSSRIRKHGCSLLYLNSLQNIGVYSKFTMCTSACDAGC